jgi:death on curing protein
VTVCPSIEEVLLIHQRALRRFGGTSGIRDVGALESAIARPQAGYHNDVIEQAVALLESLSQNHPFVDGNKRTAISVTAAFLRVNGYHLEFEDHDAYQFLIGLYEQNQFRFGALEKWLRSHARAVPHSD